MSKLTGNRPEMRATPCAHCSASGVEPGRGPLVCSMCGGVQYVNANAETEHDLMFDDHDSLRLCIKLLRKKDRNIAELKTTIHRLEKLIVSLKPYMDKKAAAELAEQVYPREITKQRAASGSGGYGD